MPIEQLPDGRFYDTDSGQVVDETTPNGQNTSDPNYITGQDIAKFKELTGRDPTEWERGWFQDGGVVKAYGSAKGALQYQANRIAEVSKKIKNIGKSQGIDLSDAEAHEIRDQFMPSTGSSGDTEINEALQYATGAVGKKVQDNLLKKLGFGGDSAGAGPSKPSGPQITADHQNTAQRLIREVYGRDANQDEVSFFASQLASGETPYEVSQFLNTTPEYLKIQTTKENERVKQEETAARAELDTQLQKSQAEVFNRASSDIISRYQKAGRIGSSGVANSLAKAQADLEKERQLFLGNAGYDAAIRREGYGRQDFVNNNAQAFNQYLRQSEPGYQQRFNLQNIGNDLNYGFPMRQLDRQQGIADQRLARGYEVDDYNRQRNDWQSAMDQQYNQQKKLLPYQLFGQLAGAGIQGLAMKSDARLKRDINKIPNALRKVLALNGVSFRWAENPSQANAGVLAQDVERVLPEAVRHDERGVKYVDYSALIGLLIEGVKELVDRKGEPHGTSI